MTILLRITVIKEKKAKLVFHLNLKQQVDQIRCLSLENIIL